MDNIRVGLDFGTHQTKICVQTIPNEGHGQPSYEFFTFKDINGRRQYFLPSLIQINEDGTVSYGYVDAMREKGISEPPTLQLPDDIDADFDIQQTANALYAQYATRLNTPQDKAVIERMLTLRKRKLQDCRTKCEEKAKEEYQSNLETYRKKRQVYRYFKQATFAERDWDKDIDCQTLSIWYLSYVIFLLEERYDKNFSINMGVPAGEKTFPAKQRLAVEILASAFRLVEEVYENKLEAFLAEKVEVLLQNTQHVTYSDDLKDEYVINVFPEAYAGLVTLTSRGKLSTGMSLTADIGGGTTDLSFFTIQGRKPAIYRYWSIPRGLNYIAEKSGFDYAEGDFEHEADSAVIDQFKRKLLEIVSNLVRDLVVQLKKETSIPVANLYAALKNRVLVYNGGGSTKPFLTGSIGDFTDVMLIDSTMWKEENLKDKARVSPLCSLLTTAYGLSICESDAQVCLCHFTNLFDSLPKKSDHGRDMVDKDCC